MPETRLDATSSDAVWLTQEQYDRLKAELDYLSTTARRDVVKKIEAARAEGDLRENGGYHAAKEEQGMQEARISQLTRLLRDARVGTPPASTDAAGPGMVVEVEFDDGERERFLLGTREAGVGDLTVYSLKSPLGQALNGVKIGESASYQVPSGATMTVKLLSAEPYTG